MTPKYLGADGIDGMDIHGLIYQYTAVKDLADDFTVTVQNEKEGGGYVFQDKEDWSQKYGMTIRKSIGLPYTPLAHFKTDGGAIATTGTGSVENAQVVYLYRFDRCFDPQSDPNCPDYVAPLPPIPEIKLYDALDDEFVEEATKKTDQDLIDEEEEKEQKEEEEEEKERLEVALSISENVLTLDNEITQTSIIDAMNAATNLTAYYVAQIPSIVYRDTLVIKDEGYKDSRLLRNLAQDQQHNKMVEAQYQ
jgi:hypothetical protein